MSQFETRYPNRFDERETPFFAQKTAEEQAVRDRGPVDIDALVHGRLPADTPGLGEVVPANRDMIDYVNQKNMPDNPLYTDPAYARAAGFADTPAMPTFAAHDDSFLRCIPRQARDVMLVSGLNHSVTSYRPIYPGDKLYIVVDDNHHTDLTPASGSEYRSIAMENTGRIYNQRGELVNECAFRVMENLKTFRPGERPEEFESWEGPDWTRREDHRYTDEDWDKIRAIWAGEEIRGAETRYWEDVNIGDEPAPTCDGPVDDSLEPIAPWGQGLGGSRTLKKEIMDPAIFQTMKRNPVDGIYRLEKRSMSYPAYPKYELRTHYNASEGFGATSFQDDDDPLSPPPERFMIINYVGRDYAVRHFINWMGDRGWLRNISWGIMNNECMKAYGYDLPENPEAKVFMEKYPPMLGKCLHHPVERDVFIIRSKVVDKYVENGDHLVEFVWWAETVTGLVTEEGTALVSLPSREN